MVKIISNAHLLEVPINFAARSEISLMIRCIAAGFLISHLRITGTVFQFTAQVRISCSIIKNPAFMSASWNTDGK